MPINKQFDMFAFVINGKIRNWINYIFIKIFSLKLKVLVTSS